MTSDVATVPPGPTAATTVGRNSAGAMIPSQPIAPLDADQRSASDERSPVAEPRRAAIQSAH
jgi:hypothetical protein